MRDNTRRFNDSDEKAGDTLTGTQN